MDFQFLAILAAKGITENKCLGRLWETFEGSFFMFYGHFFFKYCSVNITSIIFFVKFFFFEYFYIKTGLQLFFDVKCNLRTAIYFFEFTLIILTREIGYILPFLISIKIYLMKILSDEVDSFGQSAFIPPAAGM